MSTVIDIWKHRLLGFAVVAALIAAAAAAAGLKAQSAFRLEEITIDDLHAALREKRTTCRAVVDAYLRQIDAHDKQGAHLNAVIGVNAGARTRADELDRAFAQSGPVGPLHCVPLIVKDNYETEDMPTSAGSLSLQGMMTGSDAFVVARLRAAGAIVIAKVNMHEFAFSQYETVSSILPGYTRNPYDVRRVTAGSSGGTAAAVAANFGLAGIGTDTGASIRGPASFQALVGIRPTLGLTSRSGVVPVFLDSDVTGPLTRTVTDTARLLQVMAGEDPDDTATFAARGRSFDFIPALVADGLKGARLGVIRQIYDSPAMDKEVAALFNAALDDMRAAGAEIIDPVAIDNLAALRGGRCNRLKFDLNQYLAGLGDKAPRHSLKEIVASGLFHPTIQARLESSELADDIPGVTEGCKVREERRAGLRAAVLAMMDQHKLDALVYPTWSNPPRLIGDLNTPHGDNNQLLAPSTGFPAISVPMGFTTGGTLPAGLQFFGRAWSEATLLRLAYSYETRTHHRRPPPVTRLIE